MAAGDLTRLVVYPNPYREDRSRNQRVVFYQMVDYATIRLYDITGRLVKTIEKDQPGPTASWDLTNDTGKPVASGVYVYIVKSRQGEARGKIVLMR